MVCGASLYLHQVIPNLPKSRPSPFNCNPSQIQNCEKACAAFGARLWWTAVRGGGRSAFRCRTKWCGYPIARPEFFDARNHPSRLKDDLAAQDQEPVAGGIARSRRPGGIENVACKCG